MKRQNELACNGWVMSLIKKMGLDFHILATLLLRGWGVMAGGATLFIVPLCLNSTAQGFYYTFSSLLALQIFFELGLNQIIVQLVSHEMAHLPNPQAWKLIGNGERLDRLGALARLINRWYAVSAILFAVIGGSAGIVFFAHKTAAPLGSWVGVWCVLIVATAVNLWLSPSLAVMEGAGQVGHVARLRLIQSVAGYTCFWMALVAKAGLWAAIAVPVATAICTGYWARTKGDLLYRLSKGPADAGNQLSWKADVFPLQWRIALSWASGYLIFNLFTPAIFYRFGAVEAGRIGIALALFSAISTVGMSWVNAKTPVFTMRIARGERRELNALFLHLFRCSSGMVAAMSIGVVLAVEYAKYLQLPFLSRLATSDVLIVLAITTITNCIISAVATYMRAHREEPMLAQSIVVSLATACAVYVCSAYGAFAMMLAYMLITLFIALPWAVRIFLGYYRRVV